MIALHALYIIGEPGVGKSELVAALTDGWTPIEVDDPFPHRVYPIGADGQPQEVVELGRRRERFSGTDALSMAVQPKVMEWLPAAKPAMLIAEGDRLANDKWLNLLLSNGYELRLVLLSGPGAAARRRLQRGSRQDPAWLVSRQTKVRRLAQRFARWVQVLDATEEPWVAARRINSPVAWTLLGMMEGSGGVHGDPATQQDQRSSAEADARQDRDQQRDRRDDGRADSGVDA